MVWGECPLLQARFFVDPTCPHCWQAVPQVARLRQEYAGRLDFAAVFFPLTRSGVAPEPSTTLYRRQDMAAHLGEVALAMGRPMSLRNWESDPVASSWPAGLAYTAALRQDPDAALRFLEAITIAHMRQGRNIGHTGVLLGIAGQAGLDAARLERDLADPALEADLEAAVAGARARGVRSRPTCILTAACGREYWVVGPQPYEAWHNLAQAALASAGPGEPIKVGGRVLGFDDLKLGGRQPVPGGWRMELQVSGGRPGEGKAPAFQEVCFFRVGSVWGNGPAEALLREAWAAGVPLAVARGRDGEGAPMTLLGVRGGADTPVRAGARAQELAAVLRGVAQKLAVPLAEAGGDELRWLDRLLGAEGPLVNLKWTPGQPAADPCPPELAPCALLVLADPVPAQALQEEERHVRQRQMEWQAMAQGAPGPDLDDCLDLARRQLDRLTAARRSGWWHTWTIALYPPGREQAGYQAVGTAWTDRRQLLPLRPVLVAGEEADHLRLHAHAFRPCLEAELHGTPWWGSSLAGPEVARYLAG